MIHYEFKLLKIKDTHQTMIRLIMAYTIKGAQPRIARRTVFAVIVRNHQELINQIILIADNARSKE